MKKALIAIVATTAILVPIAAGCFGGGYSSGYIRDNGYESSYNPQPDHHRNERRAWRENARVPHFFDNRGQVEQWILDETRGADFNNPRDRRDAAIRASQIRERAWRETLRRHGYKP